MDRLVKRLKDKAALTDVQDSLAIESWLTLWQARLIPIFSAQGRLYEPKAPRLAELLSAHLNDSAFVERAYLFLVGRSSDPQGANYYRQLVAEEGRITALVTLLHSYEAQAYIKQQQLELPRLLCWLSGWQRQSMALPGLRRMGAWSWRVGTGMLWRRYARRWREDAEYYALLARRGVGQEELRALANTLSEMADVQKAIVAQLNTVQDARTSSDFQRWLTAEQAQAMLDILQHAQQVLGAREEGTA
ncbi:DUF4214 domain-containing protein [Halomonas sp. CH40]